MHPSLRILMRQTIKVRGVEGRTDMGGERLGPVRVVQAYVERKTRTIAGPGGEALVTSHFIVTADTDPIAKTDRIWLGPNADTDDTSQSKRPIRVDELPDFTRPDTVDHFEVYL